MNTCCHCKNIVKNLEIENNVEYSCYLNVFKEVNNEKTNIKNYSYLLMNILFFLINNYIGVISCEKYSINKEILQEHIDSMNLLIETCNFFDVENINFKMIKDIYHKQDNKIYFKKIIYDDSTKKLKYKLEIPSLENIKNNNNRDVFYEENIYKRKKFFEKNHKCNDIINFLNKELETIQKLIEHNEKVLEKILEMKKNFSDLIKKFIYIEDRLYRNYNPLKKEKYFIKIIWGNLICERIIQKNILCDIIQKINKESGLNLKFLDNNIYCPGLNYLGWEKID